MVVAVRKETTMEVSNFGRNVKALRERERITQNELADKLEITQTTVSNWETGGKQPRSKELVERICDMFSVSRQDLYGFNDGLYAKIHGLTEAPAGAIAPTPSKPAFLPLRGKVHAGDPQDPDMLEGMVELPETVAKNHPNAYFLEVEGDCMNKVYPEGCLILVDPDRMPADGSIAAVSIDGTDYVMRRLHRGASSMMLSPESTNPEHKDIVITQEDGRTVSLVGTVVWYQPVKELD